MLSDFYSQQKRNSSVPVPVIPHPIFSQPENNNSTQSLDNNLRGAYNDLSTQSSFQKRHIYWAAYSNNPWVKLSVDIRSKAGSRKVKLIPTNSSTDEEINSSDPQYSPVYKFLNEINDRQNINQLLQDIQRDLIIFGCCFIEKKTTDQLSKELVNPINLVPEIVGQIFEDGIPYRLRVLQNETMDCQYDEFGNIFRYKQIANGKEIFYSTDEIVHLTSGRNPIFGESELIPLTSIIAIDNLVNQRQSAMLFNDTTLDALFSLPEGTSSDEMSAFTKKLFDKYRKNSTDFKALVTTSEIKYQDVSRSKDADFQALSEKCKEQILQCLQVNLSVAGDSSSGLSAESNNMIRLFHEHTVRPLTNYICRVLNREVFSYYANIGLEVGLEIVLEDDEDEIAIISNKIAMLNAGLISRNEIRSELELVPIENGDVLTVVAGTVISTLTSIVSGGGLGINGADSSPIMPTMPLQLPQDVVNNNLADITSSDAHSTLLGAIKFLSNKISLQNDEPETVQDELDDEIE